jgi:hypothetical protein
MDTKLFGKVTKLDIAKGIFGFATTAGVSLIVNNVILATTPGNTSGIKKPLIYLGSYILVSMACDAAKVKAYKEVDNVVECYNSICKLKEIFNDPLGGLKNG